MRRIVAILAIILATTPVFADSVVDAAGRLDLLYDDLQQADPEDWQEIESKIHREETRSGSAAMDLLFARGQKALEAGAFVTAVEHFSALVELAPDFAEGWNARATAYFLLEEYGLAMADIARVLAINPRHFGALAGLGLILEETGDPEGAMRAYRAALAVHPYLESALAGIARLRPLVEGTDI